MKIELEEALEIFGSGMDITPYDDDDEAAIDLAIEAIKKQIPKKPIDAYKTWDYGNISRWVCPSCSYEHRSSSARSCAYKYCTDCGQAIDWSEVK